MPEYLPLMSSQSGLINLSPMPNGKKYFPPSVSTGKLNLTPRPALDPRSSGGRGRAPPLPLFGGKPWKRFSFSLFCGWLSSFSPEGKVYSGGSQLGLLSERDLQKKVTPLFFPPPLSRWELPSRLLCRKRTPLP
jgi:hypothetical protein